MVFGTKASNKIVAKTILPVTELKTACDFYRTVGFDVDEFGPGYAIVLHQGEELLHLARVAQFDASHNAAAIYLHVKSADEWHSRWKALGIEVSPIVDEDHGMREFKLKDPSGNLIRVGHNL